ncbi:hypothetical protein [Campylobacter sp. JMF_03 NE3]|uniref:hypothetical protein n=1 Tax=Campylobacter sp. JMF_03 NE3 TaxID=2983831 RepID=UPI0022E9A103|nr:hypothetical protein [Campylobacter sp. JMF_03 NE3]MDA3053582.1 hypothetical protein [Campylobacter sp. JMF_03 NE3]
MESIKNKIYLQMEQCVADSNEINFIKINSQMLDFALIGKKMLESVKENNNARVCFNLDTEKIECFNLGDDVEINHDEKYSDEFIEQNTQESFDFDEADIYAHGAVLEVQKIDNEIVFFVNLTGCLDKNDNVCGNIYESEFVSI